MALAGPLHMTTLPLAYVPWLLAILTTYVIAAQTTKTHHLRSRREWL
jgi:P-type Mg2+ transporter